jgi:hypothetical protein
LNDRIIKNGPQNENQQIANPFFRSLLVEVESSCDAEVLPVLDQSETTILSTAPYLLQVELGRAVIRTIRRFTWALIAVGSWTYPGRG